VPVFRKKPVVVEAMHFDSESAGNAIVRWAQGLPHVTAVPATRVTGVFDDGDGPYLTIDTLEGRMRCGLGWWVIRGVVGELYPCEPLIFEATYELVADPGDEARGERIAAAAIAYGRASTAENRDALMTLLELGDA